MSISLPPPIAAYFAADAADGNAVAACFTPEGVVRDEGRTHEGRAAISRWRADVGAKFAYVVAPLAVAQDGDRVVVTGRLTGDFPGSPVELTYAFTLEGSLIARLEIG